MGNNFAISKYLDADAVTKQLDGLIKKPIYSIKPDALKQYEEEYYAKKCVKSKEMIEWADIIYVGGGNTLKMMNAWRKYGFDKLMLKAYDEGKVLYGISAGAICFSKYGNSDSRRFTSGGLNMIRVTGINLVNILLCPHYNVEETIEIPMENVSVQVNDATYNTNITVIENNKFYWATNGDVLICDNDNVAPYKENLGIQGKPRYMAPEIVTLEKKPDSFSDRFSLAVILFLLMFKSHPLMGKADNNKTDPVKNEMNLYCKNPVFIFDPKDEFYNNQKRIMKN